jgi:predicted MPP superfamily phosphohydrolase
MKKIILIIFLLGVLIFGYYVVFFEPNNIQIKRQTVVLKNLPQSFNGAKIVQFSDFHSYWFGGREKRVLKIDDLEKAMEGVEENKPKILLAHAAEIIDQARNWHLILAD